MLKSILTYAFLLFLAFLAVFIVAHQTEIEVQNKKDLATLSCGWPLEFVKNNLSYRDPPYPYTIGCFSGSLGDPDIELEPLMVNMLVFYFSFVFLLGIYHFARKRAIVSIETVIIFLLVPLVILSFMNMVFREKSQEVPTVTVTSQLLEE